MKTTIIGLLLIVISGHIFAQNVAQTKDYYLAKSTQQKKVAWIMLTSGTALTTFGVAITKANSDNYTHGNSSNTYVSGSIVTVIGVAAAFGSIPVFIRAAHNKSAAISLSANLQNLQTLHATGAVAIAQPSIRIKLNL